MKKNNNKQFIIFSSIILLAVLSFGLYFYSEAKQVRLELESRDIVNKNNDPRINLTPHPIEELFALDFANVEEGEIEDPSKCNSTRFLDEMNAKFEKDYYKKEWHDFDRNIYKFKMLDDCWREYENEYITARFRDINNTLQIDEKDMFYVSGEENSYNNGIVISPKSNKNYTDLIKSYDGKYRELISVKCYKNKNNMKICRINSIDHGGLAPRKVISYIAVLPNNNRYILILSGTKRVTKEIISTIKLK